MNDAVKEIKFPEYVTDGSHIYLWHPEYEGMLADGRLRPSGPPEVPKPKALSPREQTKLDQARAKAIKEAEMQLALLKSAKEAGKDLTNLFGDEPKDEKEVRDM